MSRLKTIWNTFIAALRGDPRDYTSGSISQAVIFLAIPMVLEMLMESVFAVTDIFFVGHLGSYAIATIGLTESLLTVVYTVAFGLSVGAMALIARRVGEKDEEEAANTAVQVILLGGLVSLVIAVIGVSFAPELLRLMGGTPDVVEQGAAYMRIMFGGNAVILLLFLANAIHRGAGDGSTAMRALAISNGINLLLAPCFVLGLLFFPKLDLTGAAVATTVARGLGALYSLSRLVYGTGRVRIQRRHFGLHPEVMWKIVKLSGSVTVQIFISTASWIGMVRVVSFFGSDAVAGYTIGIRTILFAIFPAFGMSNAAATMVGQNLGAKKPDRAEKAVWLAAYYNMLFLGSMGVLFFVFAHTLVSWFTDVPAVHGYAVSCLRIISCGFLFNAFGIVVIQSLNGAGDTWTPTWINFGVFWLFEIPAAYLLSIHFKMGPQGAFLAVCLAFSLLAVVSAIPFRRGHWKKQTL